MVAYAVDDTSAFFASEIADRMALGLNCLVLMRRDSMTRLHADSVSLSS
jgi:hypothetical protein